VLRVAPLLVFLTASVQPALSAAVSGDAVEPTYFRETPKSLVPKALIESQLCPDPEEKACWEVFEQTGAAWVGDVNGDGLSELLVYPGLAYTGSGGRWYFLYQERQGRWVSLFFGPDDEGWQIRHPRFDILPIVRNGYHDLRLSHDTCFKWNGTQYELYEADDYHKLSPQLFDPSDPAEAEILWNLRYHGLKEFTLEPQWFRPDSGWTDSPVNTRVDDPGLGLSWVAFSKAGVWGVKGKERFLLLPQPAYLGASKLQLSGEWLLIYGEAESDDEAQPVARYQRRTSKLEMLHGDLPEE